MIQPMYQFKTEIDLVTRLTSAVDDSDRKVAFLFGSGLTMPVGNDPGVPSVASMIQMISLELKDSTLPARCQHEGAKGYQMAFGELLSKKGPDRVNRLVRKAVVHALKPENVPTGSLNNEECERLMRKSGVWHLPAHMQALGKLVALYPRTFGDVILCSGQSNAWLTLWCEWGGGGGASVSCATRAQPGHT
jgi:hypothetical protein